MSKFIEFKCPNCGGVLKENEDNVFSKKGKVKIEVKVTCQHCGSEFVENSTFEKHSKGGVTISHIGGDFSGNIAGGDITVVSTAFNQSGQRVGTQINVDPTKVSIKTIKFPDNW